MCCDFWLSSVALVSPLCTYMSMGLAYHCIHVCCFSLSSMMWCRTAFMERDI